jgi:hypothetical protein
MNDKKLHSSLKQKQSKLLDTLDQCSKRTVFAVGTNRVRNTNKITVPIAKEVI